MSDLSERTRQLVCSLFNSQESPVVCKTLISECGTKALSCDGWTMMQMERLHFAVLKLAKESGMNLDEAVKLARKDWRDLLVSSGFSNDLNAHESWANGILNEQK